MTSIATGFSATKPISCAQGRYGEVIIAQGGNFQPKRWKGSGSATNAGIVAPPTAPTFTVNTAARFYVARTDIVKPGSVYFKPPVVTFTAYGSQPAGHVPAKAAAYLNQASIGEVIVTKGGRNYSSPPNVSLSATHGSGAVLTAELDGTPPPPDDITHYEVIQGPPYDDEYDVSPYFRSGFMTWSGVKIPLTNGTGSIPIDMWIFHGGCDGNPAQISNYLHYTSTFTYTVEGCGSGSGAEVYLNFYGAGFDWLDCQEGGPFSGCACSFVYHSARYIRSATVAKSGSGYPTDSPVKITVPSYRYDGGTNSFIQNDPEKNLIIEGYPPGHAKNTSTPRFSVKKINLVYGGGGYVVAPDIRIDSPTGFGAYATCTVSGGAVSSVTLHSPGGGYKFTPTVTAVAGGAEVSAVARPHLRGKYQCYYRYVDDTPESKGGPIPSNLSPVKEVDAGDGAASIQWDGSLPSNTDGRKLFIECWRTTGDQALMLYRVKTLEITLPAGVLWDTQGYWFEDDLTDEELRDPDREGYAAMPIVLPNGNLNAMRFTPPPNNKAAVVRYQDRFWYGVDTSGTEPNSIYFSEVDEPESVPEINEFVLQQNARDGDCITALIPFGTSMLVMQSRHAYSLSFSKDPLLDADVTPLAYRGCLNQRCWDIHAGICYTLDQNGVYTVTPQGEVDDLSAPIDDIFRTQVDWTNTTWNFVLVDAVKKVVRVFVAFKADASTGYPTRALCYSINTKSWWVERYPHRISSGTAVPLSNGDYRPVYGAAGGAYLLDEGSSDLARGAVDTVTVTNKGAGYRKPPTVTAAGGVGAEFEATLDSQGRISGIWITSVGTGYTSGPLVISAPDDPACPTPVQATATFTATATNTDTAMSPLYRYRTGNREFPTDMTSQKGGSVQSRDVVVTYRPQPSACDLAVRLYYNNSKTPRPYVASRNRGVGFSASTVDGAARLDMSHLTTTTGADNGVAKASLASRSVDDIQSSDRHVAVELLGARRTAEPVVIYKLDVYGTTPQG